MGHKGKPKSEYHRFEYDSNVFQKHWFFFALWAGVNARRKVEFCEAYALFFNEEDKTDFEEIYKYKTAP